MKRRLFLLCALWVAAIAPLIAQKFKTSSLPNVIYIYLDDMGYGELGSYGQQKIKTPTLDKMAAGNKSFDPDEPTIPKKVVRGGSFLCHDSYCASYRVSARMKTATDTGLEHTGFRCVTDASSEKK